MSSERYREACGNSKKVSWSKAVANTSMEIMDALPWLNVNGALLRAVAQSAKRPRLVFHGKSGIVRMSVVLAGPPDFPSIGDLRHGGLEECLFTNTNAKSAGAALKLLSVPPPMNARLRVPNAVGR